MSQNFNETDAQTWGRAGSTSCNCFLGAQPPWTVAVSMRSFGSERYCRWMNLCALVVELMLPEAWDSGENMWKMLVASAPAEAANLDGAAARITLVWSGCTGSLMWWEKPALNSSLKECFFLLFPRRFPWVYKRLHFPSA